MYPLSLIDTIISPALPCDPMSRSLRSVGVFSTKIVDGIVIKTGPKVGMKKPCVWQLKKQHETYISLYLRCRSGREAIAKKQDDSQVSQALNKFLCKNWFCVCQMMKTCGVCRMKKDPPEQVVTACRESHQTTIQCLRTKCKDYVVSKNYCVLWKCVKTM